MSNKQALIQVEKKSAKSKSKIELEVNRSLFSELNEYARFAKIPGRTLKEKRERLIVAMMEKILADDEAFKSYKQEKKAEEKAKRAEAKKMKEELIKESVALDKEQEIAISEESSKN